jgi:hypothetical protein
MAYVFYNTPYGGFCWPDFVCAEYERITGQELYPYGRDDQERSNPLLVKLMLALDKADWLGLEFREVPDGTRYYIHEYDGSERVVTQDEQEWAVARDG